MGVQGHLVHALLLARPFKLKPRRHVRRPLASWSNPSDAASSIRTSDRVTMPLGSGVQPRFLPQQASTLLSPAMRNSDDGMADMPYIEGTETR